MKEYIQKILLVAVAMTCAAVAFAQPRLASCGDSSEMRGDTIRISLITCYPGSEIYELYGHTELRVATPSSDVVYNYGIFDFNTPNFTYRFVKGETDYMVKGYPSQYMSYGYEGRRIVEQVLNLTQAVALAIKNALEVNAMPENCTYRYNYVLDNCATRPRDIVEKAIGKSLQYPAMPEAMTFREEMHRYNKNYAWQQFGIDLVLGPGLDYELDYRKEMFVPMVLMGAFGGATYEQDGNRVPLVAYTQIINPGSEDGAVLPPTPWYATPMMVGVVLLMLVVAMSVRDVRRGRTCKALDFVMLVAYGLVGCLIFFLIFVSTHEATSPNYNALWLHPLYFIPAILMWIKSCRKMVYFCHFLIFAVVLLTITFWWAMPQAANAAFFPLMALPGIRSFSYILINRKCVKKETT